MADRIVTHEAHENLVYHHEAAHAVAAIATDVDLIAIVLRYYPHTHTIASGMVTTINFRRTVHEFVSDMIVTASGPVFEYLYTSKLVNSPALEQSKSAQRQFSKERKYSWGGDRRMFINYIKGFVSGRFGAEARLIGIAHLVEKFELTENEIAEGLKLFKAVGFRTSTIYREELAEKTAAVIFAVATKIVTRYHLTIEDMVESLKTVAPSKSKHKLTRVEYTWEKKELEKITKLAKRQIAAEDMYRKVTAEVDRKKAQISK